MRICHPDKKFSDDTSRMFMYSLAFVLLVFSFVVCGKLFKGLLDQMEFTNRMISLSVFTLLTCASAIYVAIWCINQKMPFEPFEVPSMFFLVLLAFSIQSLPMLVFYLTTLKRCNQTQKAGNSFITELVTLATLILAIVCLMIAVHVDSQNITQHKNMSFAFDDGFLIIETSLIFLTLFLLFTELTKMKTNFWASIRDPKAYMVMFSLVSAICVLLFKTRLTQTGEELYWTNGLTALGITFAWVTLIIKIGQNSETTFGTFVTHFHVILRRIPFYFFAFFMLIIGFSFGFWVLNRGGPRFTDFSKSFMTTLLKAFGEFNYDEFYKEIKNGEFSSALFANILIITMVLLANIGMLQLMMSNIIADHDKNMKEVYIQRIIFMCRHVILFERWFSRCVE
jgi:hypothetical protein